MQKFNSKSKSDPKNPLCIYSSHRVLEDEEGTRLSKQFQEHIYVYAHNRDIGTKIDVKTFFSVY